MQLFKDIVAFLKTCSGYWWMVHFLTSPSVEKFYLSNTPQHATSSAALKTSEGGQWGIKKIGINMQKAGVRCSPLSWWQKGTAWPLQHIYLYNRHRSNFMDSLRTAETERIPNLLAEQHFLVASLDTRENCIISSKSKVTMCVSSQALHTSHRACHTQERQWPYPTLRRYRRLCSQHNIPILWASEYSHQQWTKGSQAAPAYSQWAIFKTVFQPTSQINS